MKILLTCVECEYTQYGTAGKELMNKVIMWNHVKKAHASTAERIMRLYKTVPDYLYGQVPQPTY